MDSNREITIYDIAGELKLSASTVSRALNGNPIINEKTRVKVAQCAEKMGYRSNSFASNLRKKRTNTIGVIVPRLDSNFMSACLAGMEEVFQQQGYNMIISQSHESIKHEAKCAKTMYNNRVDGLIVSLTIENGSLDHFRLFDNKNVPVVFFDRVPENTEKVCLIIDNYNAAKTATKHLIQNECKRLLHLTIDSKSNVYSEREKGFWDAINECSNFCEGEVIYIDQLNLEHGKKFAHELSTTSPLPDGIFVSNDMAAVGCIIGLQEKGIKVPSEIAVIGFNNDAVSTIVSPKLTTINYPGKDAGILAAKKLIDNLNGLEKIKSQKLALHSELIVRESTIRKSIK